MKKNLTAMVFSIAILLSGRAQAMSVDDFARMNDDDEATYVSSLVEGVSKHLRAQGQAEQAQKLINVFKDSSKEGGLNQFAFNLKSIHTLNMRNAANPNNRVPIYEVEDAMGMTLKDNGIMIPVSYLKTLTKDFKPVGPRRQYTVGQ